MLTSLLNADADQMRHDMQQWEFECSLAQSWPRVYAIYCLFNVKLPSWWHRNVTCRLFDHDLENDSVFGPDSGTEILYCKRNCGYSWHHIYY